MRGGTWASPPAAPLSSQVHIANQCEAGGLRLAEDGFQEARKPEASHVVTAALPSLPTVLSPDTPAPVKPSSPWRARDPNTCFFEGQHRPHGSRWAPNYDRLCSICTCQVGGSEGCTGAWVLGQGFPLTSQVSLQKRTVICDPVVCAPLSCLSPVQVPDQCCPVCPGECHAGEESWRVLPWGMRPLGRGEGIAFCLHYFFGSVEKEDVRELAGLPRSRDSGEGELAVYEPVGGGENREDLLSGTRKGTRG